MTSQLEAQQFSIASYIAENIEGHVKLRINSLAAIAERITPELISNPGKLREFLHDRFLYAALFQTGVEVVSTKGVGIADYPALPGRAGGMHADLDFVRTVVATGKPAVGKPRTGRFSDKRVIPFAVPVLDPSGTVVAVLAGYASVSDPALLGSIEKSEYKAFPDRVVVVSPKYRIHITGSDPTRIMTPTPKTGINPLFDRFMSGFEGSGITVNSRGIRILISAKQIPTPGWFVRVELPTDIAFAPVRSMKNWAYSLAFGMSLLSSFFAWLIIRQALRPLYAASKLINDMTEERVPLQDIPVTQYDEVGQLLASFNVHLNYRKQMEEALRQSREQLDLALISSKMAVFEWDIVKNKRTWSDGVHRLLGTNPEAFTGAADEFFQIIHPEDRSTVQAALDRAVETTGQYETEYRAVWPDGSIHHIMARGKIHRDSTGQAVQMTGVCWDVTGSKQAEDELRSVTQRLKLATQSAKVGVWDWDIANNIMVWDDRMLELYGLTRETFPGRVDAWRNGLHPDDSAKAILECEAALRGEKEFDAEFRVMHPDGTVKVLKGNALVVRDAEGKAVRMLGLNRDITELREAEEKLTRAYADLEIRVQERTAELSAANIALMTEVKVRKLAEEYLRKSENKYRTLMENLPQKIFYKDRNSVFISCNKNLADDLRIKPDEFAGKTDYDFFPKELAEKYRTDDERLMELGKSEDIEEKYIRDGQEVWVNTVKTPVMDDSGNVTGILGIFWDITERKLAEERVKASLREKEILLREIHHRVKNNLAVISSLLRLQALGANNESLSQALEESQQRIKSMALVHEHLYQARDFSSINYKDFINDIVNQLEAIHHKRNGTIVTKLNIEDLTLDIDSAIPCSLIINELITNAYKYAFPGNRSGELSISFTKQVDTYILAIKDNGIGLPEGFDYRKSNTIGLQIVNVLCKQLGGTLQMRSDRGTEAVITFKTAGNK